MARSLREFSRLAGVAPSTVSRVFSGSGRVSLQTQQRIRELADSLGFRPNAIGQVAFGGQTRSVGVLVPSIEISFYAQVVRGLEQELLNIDYLPIMLHADSSSSDTRSIQRLLDHCVDGMLLTFSSEALTPDDLAMVIRAQVPIVILGAFRAQLALDAVDNDDTTGGRSVGEHLIQLGHQRFGFCYYGEGHTNSDMRLTGFREALNIAGLKLPEKNILRLHPFDPKRSELMRASLIELLSEKNRPTAIFASTDEMARLVYLAANDLKLSIPKDLSVVGYGNLNYSELINPPLTTVDQDGKELGRRAAKMIIERLENPSAPPRVDIVPTHLVVRQSTAKPPNLR